MDLAGCLVIQMLSEPLLKEVKLLIGIEGEAERTEKELRLMQSLMERVEALEQPDDYETKWAHEAGVLFHEIENVIDRFLSKTSRYRKRGTLQKSLLLLTHLYDRVKLRRKMKKIKAQIKDMTNTIPIRLPNPQALASSSEGAQTNHLAASSAVSSAVDKINTVLRKKMLFSHKDRVSVESLRGMFGRLHGLVLDDYEPGKALDERERAWMGEIIVISRFTKDNYESFIRRREAQLARRKRLVFRKLYSDIKDRSFRKTVARIKFRILGLYRRKWLFGIGDMKAISTSMVSIVKRLSLNTRSMNRNRCPYAICIGYFTCLVCTGNPCGPYGPCLLCACGIAICCSYTGKRRVRSFVRRCFQSRKMVEDKLESVRRDLRLMEALFKDFDGVNEDLYERVKIWLNQMREVAKDPVAKDLLTKKLNKHRIISMTNRIDKKFFEISERKWTYDIGKLEGRRLALCGDQPEQNQQQGHSDCDESDDDMRVIRDEVDLMDAMIKDAESVEEQGGDARLKVWVDQTKDIAADGKELINGAMMRCEKAHRKALFNRRIGELSRRKWIYGIGGIRGRIWVDSAGSPQPHSQKKRRHGLSIGLMVAGLCCPGLAHSVKNLEVNVESIQAESDLIHALLEDAQGMGKSDRSIESWLKEVTRVAAESDAAIDDYKKFKERGGRKCWSIRGRVGVAKKIQQIMNKIQYVYQRRMGFPVEINRETLPPLGCPRPVVPRIFSKGQPISRFSDDLQAVLGQLLTKNEDSFIISVVGMGGIGKTTLAECIYRNNIVVDLFPCRVWVSLSPDCNAHYCLNRIALNEVELDKRALVVLDGVRTTEFWDVLIQELRSILHGRRFVLLITTCNIGVAIHADPKSTPHKLQLLNDDDSWALFTQKLVVPDGLTERCRKMVIKCGGLPRMITKLSEQFSGLDSTAGAWKEVLDQEIPTFVDQNPVNIDQSPWEENVEVIRGLSVSLRHCLFYLNSFPADFEIPLRRLILLWVAEGLLLHQWWADEDLASPESVAESYLTELTERCLVQVTKRKLNGAVKKCRIPYEIHKLLSLEDNQGVKKGFKSSFSNKKMLHLTHYVKEEDATPGPNRTCITNLSASALSGHEHVITFRSFDNREGNRVGGEFGEFLDRCISRGNFLIMRVLDLERVFRPVLPKALGLLVLLKYLGLRWTYLEFLPSFLSKLLNLQTLDLKHTSISRLPDSIWKMGQLRHLFLDEYYHCRFVRRPRRYSLPHLQTLWNVFIDEDSPVQGGLDSSINLTRLGVECRLMSHQEGKMLSQLKAVANWVQTLKELKSLRLKSFDKCGKPWNIPLETLSGQKKLWSLYLLGRVQKDLVISGLPLNLTELTLSGSGLEDDPMQLLKTLTNLRSLSLFSDSFVGKQMLALPILGDLEIRSCKRLKTFPDELQNSKTLQKLNFSDMPEEWDEIRETFFARHEENAEDKYDVTHTPASIFSPTQVKTVHRRNETGEPSYGTSSMSGNISASLSAGEPSHYKRTKSDNTAASLSSGAFVQLQILKIRKLDKHEEWNEDRAFQTITDVDISSCKGNEETMADKYEVARTPVPILSSIKEKIEMQKLRMSQKLFLKKLASEELKMHPWECPFCGVERESAIHLFFLCTPIKMVWFSNYGVKTDDFSNLSISEWIDHILTPTLLYGGILPNQGDFIRFSVTLMETIWSWRNKFISGAAQTFHPDMIHKNAVSSFTSALYIRE